VRGGNYSTSIEKKSGGRERKNHDDRWGGLVFYCPVWLRVCVRVLCVWTGANGGRGSGTVRCTLYREGLGSGCGNDIMFI
jgi:hypothetical protein